MTNILVNNDLCTRCGICSLVCPLGIVEPGEGSALPRISESMSSICIRCGHCEVHCPSHALMLGMDADDTVRLPHSAGNIMPTDIGYYLKKRRSVRRFTNEPVPKEKIIELLDCARYAPSGGNGQPVEWLIVHNPAEVHRLAGLTIEWMETLRNSSHPMSAYVPGLIAAWKSGNDVICRGAPHLVIAHIPDGNPVAAVDAIIALTHFDIAAPAFGIGACWAGFLSMAAKSSEPVRNALALPEGRQFAYSLFFGNPQYRTHGIPRRNPLKVTWR